MREHAARAGDRIHRAARRDDLVVGQEQVERIVDRRAGQQRHLGVAVDEDLLHVVRELHAVERLLVRERRIPELLGELREAGDALLAVVVAHEMRLAIEDELAGEGACAILGHARRGGLGARGVEHGPNTVFMATKAADIPALPTRNWRRPMPCRGASSSASASISLSTRCCARVCGNGVNSPLEIIWVGTGEPSAAVSAVPRLRRSSSLRYRMDGLPEA